MLDDTQFAEPLKEAEKALKPFVVLRSTVR
jgi:hypothetical protein